MKKKNSGNGKGSRNRTTNLQQFQNNYNKIKWQRPSGELNTDKRSPK